MKYKLDPEVVYSDTDSIFTTDKTPFENIISKDLGDFKDSSEFNEFGESKTCRSIFKYNFYFFLTNVHSPRLELRFPVKQVFYR